MLGRDTPEEIKNRISQAYETREKELFETFCVLIGEDNWGEFVEAHEMSKQGILESHQKLISMLRDVGVELEEIHLMPQYNPPKDIWQILPQVNMFRGGEFYKTFPPVYY